MNRKEVIQALLAKEKFTFDDLVEIMRILRAEGGCPWDREQTHKSIRSCMIEEAYEAVEAIDTDDPVLLREELGDVLFQVVFHAQLEAEQNVFDASDVVHDISVKMIHRHPHVFADTEVSGAAEALSRWDAIKTEEKQRKTLSSRLRAIPPMLPALMRASKVAKKSGVLDAQNPESLCEKLRAQTEALAKVPATSISDAVGELLLTVAELSALLGIDAEHALGQATDRLISEVERREG